MKSNTFIAGQIGLFSLSKATGIGDGKTLNWKSEKYIWENLCYIVMQEKRKRKKWRKGYNDCDNISLLNNNKEECIYEGYTSNFVVSISVWQKVLFQGAWRLHGPLLQEEVDVKGIDLYSCLLWWWENEGQHSKYCLLKFLLVTL